MKTLRLMFLYVAVSPLLALWAQPGSMLGRLHYTQSPETAIATPRLDAAIALQALTPLPDFELPDRLPPELQYGSKDLALYRAFQEVNQLLSRGEAEAAIAILRDWIAQRPEEIALRISLADSLFSTGAYAEAVQEYRLVLKSAPGHFQCLNNLAWLYATVRIPEIYQPAEALKLAKQARMIRPLSHHVWSTLSSAHYELGNYPEAELSMRNALQLARQENISPRVMIQYLFQLDRCVMAREATSILQ